MHNNHLRQMPVNFLGQQWPNPNVLATMKAFTFRLHSFILLCLLLTGVARADEAYWEYTFQPGDSLWKVAKTYTNSVNNWRELQKLNRIGRGHDRQIRPGVRIRIPVRLLKQQPAPAVVTSTTAGVRLIRRDKSEHKLAVGDKLYSGDRIITQNKQFVSLRFADGSMLTILPQSTVSMDRLSRYRQTGMIDTRVRLESGNVDTSVEKQAPGNRYEISTPTAVTEVRGTGFRVAASSPTRARTEVSQGTVEVSAGGSQQSVPAGYGIVAEKGKPLAPPVKLLDPPSLQFSQTMQLSWRPLDKARAYRLQLAKDARFTQIVDDRRTSALSIDLAELAEGDYHLRLRGIDAQGLEGRNGHLKVTIRHLPPPPPPKKPEADTWPLLIPAGVFLLTL